MDTITIVGNPLYQWEIGRRVQVKPLPGKTVDAVHFSNYGDTDALVVEPYQENGKLFANIPNILLQSGNNIVVYSVNVSEGFNDTLRSCMFNVRRRARPADYVYTETEVKNYNDLDRRIVTLGDALQEAIFNLDLLTAKVYKLTGDVGDLTYTPIVITSISNSVGVKEIGSKVNDVVVYWSLNKEPISQTLNGEPLDVSESDCYIPGPFRENREFTLSVTDERDVTDVASTHIQFFNGVYVGVLDQSIEVDSAAVLSLKRNLQGSRTLTFTANAGAVQRIVYALPTRYGTPNFNVGGFDGGFELVKTFDFTNGSGYTESYAVWMSDNAGLGKTTVRVT